MKKINLLKKIALFAMGCSFSVLAFGQPTVITDRAGLENIKNNPAGSYILENDIDLSDSEWTRIEEKFTGTLDGNGYVIKGLTINSSNNDNTGMFREVADGVGIKNLGIDGANVVGKAKSGILAGILGNASIENCWIVNSTMKGTDHVGGFVGRSHWNAKIKNSYVWATITATGGHAGGLSGNSDGAGSTPAVIIEKSYFTGIVNGTGFCGGILGIVEQDKVAQISNCVNLASSVTGSGSARRIIGDRTDKTAPTLTNNYSLASTLLNGNTVSSSNAADKNGADITEEQSKSQVFYEGLGWDFENIWEMGAVYPQLQVQRGISVIVTLTELQPGEVYNLNDLFLSSTDLTFSTTSSDIVIGETTLTVVENLSAGIVSIPVHITAGADFEMDVTFTAKMNPITIRTAEQLEWLKLYPAGSFKLLNDIDMADYTWEPCQLHEGAVLDGDGYVIKNLKVDKSGTSDIGLINKGTRCTIKNLGMENAYMNGNELVGAIVGYSDGATVHNCWVINSYIEGRHKVGSIVGGAYWNTKVENCYAVANVKAREGHAGGIVGTTQSGNNTSGDYDNPDGRPALRIGKNYFVGTVQGNEHVTGIVGRIDNETGKLYARGNVNFATTLASGQTANVHRITSWGATQTDRKYSLENNYSISTTLVNGTALTEGLAADNWNGANIPSDKATQAFFETLGWSYTAGTDWKTVSTGSYPALQAQKTLTLPYLALENTIVVTSGTTVNLNEKFISGTGATITFASTSNLVTITDGVIKITGVLDADATDITITLSVEGYQSATIPVTLAKSTIAINNVDDFLAISNLALTYQLNADIDLTGKEFNGFGSKLNPFTGTFDGNGHIVSGLTCTVNGEVGAGLFRATNGATIKRLGVEGATVKITSESKSAGIIIGEMNGGLLEECYSANSYVEGWDHAGGLVGSVYGGTLKNSYSTAKVHSREHQAGGLVGAIQGGSTIENCYFSGVASNAGNRTIGLGGYHDQGVGAVTIKNSLSLAQYLLSDGGNPVFYRIFDNESNRSMSLTNNYALSTMRVGKSDLSSLSTISTDDNVADGRNGADVSLVDAKTSDFYATILGWDLTDTWTVPAGAYPVLKWQADREDKIATAIYMLKDSYSFTEGSSLDLTEYIFSSNGLALDFDNDNSNASISNGIMTVTGNIVSNENATVIPKITETSDFAAVTAGNVSVSLYPATTTVQPVAVENQYVVFVKDNVLRAYDLTENTTVNIYNIGGQLISEMKVSESLQYVLPAKGFYVVEFVNNDLRSAVKLINK